LVVGVSRKSFLGKILDSSRIEDRAWPTVALTSYLREQGANVLRVHDVKPNVEALRMTEAILKGAGA
jgi:dihydropteroate synthase